MMSEVAWRRANMSNRARDLVGSLAFSVFFYPLEAAEGVAFEKARVGESDGVVVLRDGMEVAGIVSLVSSQSRRSTRKLSRTNNHHKK